MPHRVNTTSFNERLLRVLGYFLLPVITLVIGYQLGNETKLALPGVPFGASPTTDSSAIDSPTITLDNDAVTPLAGQTTLPFSVDQLERVFAIVRDNFLYQDRIKVADLAVGAIIGMVEALNDRHTVFMRTEENEDFQNELRGEVEGIGAYLTSRRGSLEVISVLKGSPAKAAGMLPGDIIIKVGDTYTSDLFFYEAVTKIRGPKGTKVSLEIQRPKKSANKLNGENFELLKKEIMRDSLKVPSITWEKKDKSLVYLSINHFTANTVSEFRQAVAEIALTAPRGLVLDLRFNPGGYMDAAIMVASEFLSDQVVVKRKDRDSERSLKSRGAPTWPDLPLVVLINKGSASASEIVASALKDNGRAELVGETTFGKGSIQETFPFADGTLLKLTTSLWLTPNGVNVEEVGITPDHLVEVAPDQVVEEGKDIQLDKALEILRQKVGRR